MATINIEPTTASFTATGGQGTITLTDTASASWHDTPQSGDNWAAIREKEEGTWSDWFVFSKNGGGVSGDYLPLAGGDMTGAVRMTVGSNTTYLKSYALGHASGSSYTYDGYLTANSNGAAWLYGRTELNLVSGYSSPSQGKLTVTASDVTFNGTSILGGNISEATTGSLGGFKLSVNKRSTNVPSSSFITGGTTGGRYYGVEMNNAGQLYVNVPWSSGTGGSTVSWGTVSGNTVQLTVDNQTKTLLLSTYSPDLSGYLPLSAGSGKALTGTLYSRAIYPNTNSTSQSTGYGLGSSSNYWRYIYTRRVYLSSSVYIEYDSTNECVRVYGAGIATDSYISAGGVQST